MTVQLHAFLSTLMRYAHELGRARRSGDEAAIREARERHDRYAQLCLRDDVNLIDDTKGIQ
jgi:hypothetical protein